MEKFVHRLKYINISQKGRYFENILKKSSFAYISENMNILIKRMFSWDNFEIKCFLSIFPKISTFRGKIRYFEITLKNHIFGNIFENVAKLLFIYSEEYIVSWEQYKKYLKKVVFLDLFKKIVFCPYFRKYQHFEENDVFLRSL